ncbi:MAG TPA: DsbA family oxidoreductase [Burkholderiales bacterium]|nr:DsbA family oxidoreductase [Burkholderiales bacterium]
MAVRIAVISDVVCPWCFIGKRRLESALELMRGRSNQTLDIEVVWHPFQLNSDLPAEGIERSEYIARKFGPRAQDIYGRVSAVGRSVGIDFAFERIVRQPNAVAAHQLIAIAQDEGRQEEMVEPLFQAYFLEGVDLTRTDSLLMLAERAGLPRETARLALEDDARRQAVAAADHQARALGVSGVPFFIFDRRLAVSGAQEPEVLVRAISEAALEPAEQR